MNSKKTAKLYQIYRSIPDIGCKGLCTSECTVLGMTIGEYINLAKRTGIEPAVDKKGACIYLKAGRCSVYEHRPLICRLFGTAADLPCPHGCAPKITPLESFRLVEAVNELGGNHVYTITVEGMEKLLDEHTIIPVKRGT